MHPFQAMEIFFNTLNRTVVYQIIELPKGLEIRNPYFFPYFQYQELENFSRINTHQGHRLDPTKSRLPRDGSVLSVHRRLINET